MTHNSLEGTVSAVTDLNPTKDEPEPAKEDFGRTVWGQALHAVTRFGDVPGRLFQDALASWTDSTVPEPRWPQGDLVRLQEAREAYAGRVWEAAVRTVSPNEAATAAALAANPYDSTPIMVD